MSLIDFDARFPNRDIVDHAYKNPSSSGDRTLPAVDVVVEAVVFARVDHGRWITDCPADGCSGAEFISLTARLFFCTECRNAANRHGLIPVAVPDEKTRAQIDAYLIARATPANQNWSTGEPVRQLRDENREHGIRLP